MNLDLTEHLNLSPYFVDNSKTQGFNWERFQDKIDAIPESLFALLIAETTSELIKSLTQKYVALSVQGPDIARLIRDVVVGDIFIGDMPAEISRRLGLDQATAREVANLIVSQLFASVLEDIKRVQVVKFPGRLPSKQPEAQSAPVKQPPPIVSQNQSKPTYQGEELPESGGNLIDLRNK